MDSVATLLDLPLSTLVVLSAGYISYRVAFVGHDGPHSPADTVFISLFFAAIAKVPAQVFAGHLSGLMLGVVGAIVSAGVWRVMGAPGVWWALRRLGISDHDRGRTVWESMLMHRLKTPRRIVVVLKDGRQLMCSDVSRFFGSSQGPCLFGPDGSVALYVTDTRKNSECDWIEQAVESPEAVDWGQDMTFVPASEIARVRIMRAA